jgi:hypothetical protein
MAACARREIVRPGQPGIFHCWTRCVRRAFLLGVDPLWAGRFHCRELVSEGARPLCGIYVELNQIRAGEALTPEDSRHCSVWYRIQARQPGTPGVPSNPSPRDGWLAPLTLQPDHLGDVPSDTRRRASDKGLLSMTLEEFLRLLDYSGRQLVPGKRGTIPADLAPILQRVGLEPDEFLNAVEKSMGQFPRRAESRFDAKSVLT